MRITCTDGAENGEGNKEVCCEFAEMGTLSYEHIDTFRVLDWALLLLSIPVTPGAQMSSKVGLVFSAGIMKAISDLIGSLGQP